MKGIIYCRVSSLEQVQGTSLENQKEACLRYAQEKGIEVAVTFIEKGESATAATRTELLKALDYCKQHKPQIGAFVVWKLDRFARNTTDHYGIQAQLGRYGTRLYSVTEPIINEGPLGKMAEAMLAGYAQFENDIRKQRCEAGMQRKIAEGIWPWHPPIGYLHSKKITDRRKTRPDEPDPERFAVIQRGLKEFVLGWHSITSLTEAFNRWGLKTRTGCSMFKQLVERMLRQKYYAGILVNPWTAEEFRGLHQPMITVEEYDQIQGAKAAWSNNAVAPRRVEHPDFPLRRFVGCTCETGLTGGWHTGRTKKYAYYNCPNRDCRYYGCYVPTTSLELSFANLLRRVQPQEEWLRVFEARLLVVWNNRRHQSIQRQHKNQECLRRLSAQRDRLVEMRLNGEISAQEFRETKQRLDGQVAVTRASTRQPDLEGLNLEAALSALRPFLMNLADYWQQTKDIETRRHFQRLVLPQGLTYNPATVSFGTAVFSPLFSVIEASRGPQSYVVAGPGQNWNQIVQDVKNIARFVGRVSDVSVLKQSASADAA